MLLPRRLFQPLRITSSPAPVLGTGHVDVTAGDAIPPVSPAVTHSEVPQLVESDLLPADVPLELVDDAPSIDSGVCYHHLHFEHDGRRFGALIHPHQHSASLLPCPYVGKAGL